jgi:UDP-2-acetamido-3-amino-2,3-dideoxy-glucuronate N-acetyltransferase
MSAKTIAIIGAGAWGKNLVRNFNGLGALKTVCDLSLSIRRQMAETYPDVILTADPETVFTDPEIQGVVIAAPAVHHYALASQALNAGKHVFVEKPLALVYEDGAELVRLAAEKEKILFAGHILQYHPAVIRLKELINKGTIGRIEYIFSHRLSLGKIRREENILWSFAPHDISIILSLAGEEPCYVDSVGSNFLHARIADVTMTNLKFPSGIGAHIFVSWLNPFKEQKLVIVGSEGMLVFDDTLPVEEKLAHYPHAINWQHGLPIPQKAEMIAIDLKDIWEEPLRAECRAFLNAIASGEQPLTPGEEGLMVLKILQLSQQSLEEKERAHPTPLALQPSPELQTTAQSNYFVHPTAIVDEHVAIGDGTKIWHFSHVLGTTEIGANCNIGQNCVIGPKVSIGQGCKIQNNISIYEGITLEDYVFCGPSMVFTNVYNPRAEIRKMDQLRPTLVKRGTTIGANATIVCGITIGQYALIGAGAVVNRDVKPHALVVGNPASQIGWVSRHGERLELPLSGEGVATCPATGEQYLLKDSDCYLAETGNDRN